MELLRYLVSIYCRAQNCTKNARDMCVYYLFRSEKYSYRARKLKGGRGLIGGRGRMGGRRLIGGTGLIGEGGL